MVSGSISIESSIYFIYVRFFLAVNMKTYFIHNVSTLSVSYFKKMYYCPLKRKSAAIDINNRNRYRLVQTLFCTEQ